MDCTNFIINDHKPFALDNKLVDVRETLSHCSLSHVLVTREAQYLGPSLKLMRFVWIQTRP